MTQLGFHLGCLTVLYIFIYYYIMYMILWNVRILAISWCFIFSLSFMCKLVHTVAITGPKCRQNTSRDWIEQHGF